MSPRRVRRSSRLDYASVLTPAEASVIVSKWHRSSCHSRVTTLGCWISRLSLNAGGYTSIRRRPLSLVAASRPRRHSRAPNLLLHRIAFLARHGRDVAVHNVASHLCGNRACFNADHIVEESQSANLSRRAPCPGTLCCTRCKSSAGPICRHTPRCLRPTVPSTTLLCLECTQQTTSCIPSTSQERCPRPGKTSLCKKSLFLEVQLPLRIAPRLSESTL